MTRRRSRRRIAWPVAEALGQGRWHGPEADGFFTASLEATDAKTITLKLKEPYCLVLESIGKHRRGPFMMPSIGGDAARHDITEQSAPAPSNS